MHADSEAGLKQLGAERRLLDHGHQGLVGVVGMDAGIELFKAQVRAFGLKAENVIHLRRIVGFAIDEVVVPNRVAAGAQCKIQALLVLDGLGGLFLIGMLANQDHEIADAIAPFLLLEGGGFLNGQWRRISHFDVGILFALLGGEVAGRKCSRAVFDQLAADNVAARAIPFADGGRRQLGDGGFGKQNRQGFDVCKLKGIHQLRNGIGRLVHSGGSGTRFLPILPRKCEARVDGEVMDCAKLTKRA